MVQSIGGTYHVLNERIVTKQQCVKVLIQRNLVCIAICVEYVDTRLVLEKHFVDQAEHVLRRLILAQRRQQREEGGRRLWAIVLQKFTPIFGLYRLVSGDKLEVIV